MRKNINIKSIAPDINPKLHSQFADDIWAALKYELQSLNELLGEFKRFADFSGLNVNFEKTKILKLGPVRYTRNILPITEPIQWSDQIKVLGVQFTANIQRSQEINFDILHGKTQALVNSWSLRPL